MHLPRTIRPPRPDPHLTQMRNGAMTSRRHPLAPTEVPRALTPHPQPRLCYGYTPLPRGPGPRDVADNQPISERPRMIMESDINNIFWLFTAVGRRDSTQATTAHRSTGGWAGSTGYTLALRGQDGK